MFFVDGIESETGVYLSLNIVDFTVGRSVFYYIQQYTIKNSIDYILLYAAVYIHTVPLQGDLYTILHMVHPAVHTSIPYICVSSITQ